MRTLSVLATLLLGVVSAAPSFLLAREDDGEFTIAQAGDINDIVITKHNTLNGTYHTDETIIVDEDMPPTSAGAIPFELVNNFGGGQVKAYIAGLDVNNKVVFVKANGGLVYPTSKGSAVPVPVNENDIAIKLPERGKTFKLNIPVPIHSGRIYFAEGSLKFSMVKIPSGDGLVQPTVANLKDPSAGTNWGFVEFTYNTDGSIYANISYVDFVGMILSMSLTAKDGSRKQLTKGLGAGVVQSICDGLASQSKNDRWNWKAMCVRNNAGVPIRVLSPNVWADIKPADFQNYWQDYVDKVWKKYGSSSLTINSQHGSVKKYDCRVRGNTMTCDGDNKTYNKPTARDIWGCNSGPFARHGDNTVHVTFIARFCAAFHRTTLLVDGGNVQPSVAASKYYKSDPTNHYSRLIHKHEVDGQGYAFAYDDVNPNGENASGVVTSGRPHTLTVYFGAPPK